MEIQRWRDAQERFTKSMSVLKVSQLSVQDLEKLSETIRNELNERYKLIRSESVKQLTLNKITAKDICVFYASLDADSDEVPNFSFYVKHDGRMYDIYYDSGKYDENHHKSFHLWWPVIDEDDVLINGASEFIPSGFCETCENCYEYDGTVKQAIACLKKHGIVDVRKGNPHDLGKSGNGEGDGIKLL